MANILQKQYDKWLRSTLRVPKNAKVPLVAAYLTLYRHQRAEALRKVNRMCGTYYQMRRFREWERGATPIPHKIKTHMQQVVIKARFGEVGEGLLRLLDLERSDGDLL